MLAPATNLTEYSVSELAFALKRTIEDEYGYVRVRGELSGFKRAGSGHCYFALKDDKACIDAVCWRNTLPRLSFEPEDGLEVVCTGRLTTYPGRSQYQIVVEQMEPAGVGALMALLEERKKKLEAEGLFASDRKRPLPFLPEVVGLVTSPTGAVIRDILHRLSERFPRHVILWPVLVQGEGAAAQVAEAIDGFPKLADRGLIPRPDVLIVARGGGSIEDLWAFNEEIVARAAAASPIPLISAVGHETDTTLIDFVADRRAPTPTAAAEIAVPVRRDLLLRLQAVAERQEHAVSRDLRYRRDRMEGLARGLADPRHLLGIAAQRLDDLAERLRLRTPSQVLKAQGERVESRHQRLREIVLDRLQRGRRDLQGLDSRLSPEPILRRIEDCDGAVERENRHLLRVIAATMQGGRSRLDQQQKLLESLSHERVLERGYAIVKSELSGHVVTSAEAAAEEPRLALVFRDGQLTVQPALTPSRQRSSPKTPAAQDELPL